MLQNRELSQVVFGFTHRVQKLPDLDLDRTWKWMGYDEGVRFASFRMMERLRLLAAQIEQVRLNQACPLSAAQRALVQYHIAFRELQALLVGLSDVDGAQRPDEKEWSVRIALAHLIEVDRAFYTVIHYTIERARSKDDRPLEISEEDFNAFLNQDNFVSLAEAGPISALLEYYAAWHVRVLADLATIQPSELDLPSIFWEPQPMPIQFRLHRFELHLRQHTVQVEKTLSALSLQQIEAIRLVRLIFAALGEAEGMALGLLEPSTHQVEELIAACTTDLAQLDHEIAMVLA